MNLRRRVQKAALQSPRRPPSPKETTVPLSQHPTCSPPPGSVCSLNTEPQEGRAHVTGGLFYRSVLIPVRSELSSGVQNPRLKGAPNWRMETGNIQLESPSCPQRLESSTRQQRGAVCEERRRGLPHRREQGQLCAREARGLRAGVCLLQTPSGPQEGVLVSIFGFMFFF